MSHVFVKQLAKMTCLGICSLATPPAQAETFVNEVIPIDVSLFVVCANGGAGENIALSGDHHVVFGVTADNAGGVHVKMQDNFQDISGEGQTTGLKYQLTGVNEFEFNSHMGEERTMVRNFRVIGQGPNNNFLFHENFHITINANGTVTSSVDNFSAECK